MSKFHLSKPSVGNPKLYLLLAVSIAAAVLSAGTVGYKSSHQYEAAPAADPTCSSASPWIEYDNGSTGPGVRGVSVGGNGIGGATEFNGTSSSNGTAGVAGADKSATGTFDVGVKGTSTNGIGVIGSTSSFSEPGVLGYEGTASAQGIPFSAAVTGSSADSLAVAAYSDTNYAVYGRSKDSSGVVGITYNPSTTSSQSYGVWGQDLGTGAYNFGVLATTTHGTGVEGSSSSGVGVYGNSTGNYGVEGVSISFPAVYGNSTVDFGVEGVSTTFAGAFGSGPTGVIGQCKNSSGSEFQGWSDGGAVNFNVNCSGAVSSIIRARNNAYATATMPRSTLPVLEDYGEAQLVNGVATIQLDPAFAQTISDKSPYLVFLTPDGDTNGLYVAYKTVQVSKSVKFTEAGPT
jgi:hypothetical protein